MFAYVDGDLVTLDESPSVSILDPNGDVIPSLSNLPTCARTKGVYEVIIPPITGFNTPCQFSDIWTNVKYQGNTLPDIENEFVLQPYKNRMMIGTQSREPEIFGFDFYTTLKPYSDEFTSFYENSCWRLGHTNDFIQHGEYLSSMRSKDFCEHDPVSNFCFAQNLYKAGMFEIESFGKSILELTSYQYVERLEEMLGDW